MQLAVTVCSEKIYSDDPIKTLYHGHSYRANHLGCAARLASKELMVGKGLLLRPLGNVLYLMPPYCITDEELSVVYEGIYGILKAI